MRKVRAAILGIELISELFSIAAMAAITLLIGVDVVGRYVFNMPIGVSYSLTTMYLMVALFFFGFASTQSSRNHIGVDLFTSRMQPRGQHICEAICCVLSAPIFAYVAYIFAEAALKSFERGEVVVGVISWPSWPAPAIASYGASLLTLRLVLDLIGSLDTILTGRDHGTLIPASSDPTSITTENSK